MELGLIILAGGKSSRMGQDKAFLPWCGQNFICALLKKARTYAFKEIVLVTNKPKDFESLEVVVIEDIYPQLGPLSGMHAGLSYGKLDYYLVVPCDMPFLDFSIADELSRYAEDYQAVILSCENKVQPLPGIYHRSCATMIETMLLITRERKLTKLLECVKTKFVPMHGSNATFFNVNTPEELIYARAKAINASRKIPIVSIVAGKSGTGKTTLIRKLIPEFRHLGLKTAVIKSDGHAFNLDQEGKDTWHFTQAGAEAVAIVAPGQFALLQQTKTKADLEEVAGLIQGVDLILVESRCHGIFPILEIAREGITEDLITPNELLAAVITDKNNFAVNKRLLPLRQPEKTAMFIKELLGL